MRTGGNDEETGVLIQAMLNLRWCVTESRRYLQRSGSPFGTSKLHQEKRHWSIGATHGFDAFEAETFVERVGVLGAEVMTDSLHLRMFQETLDDPFAKPFASMIGMNDHVTDPSKGGLVGHAPNESNQLTFVNEAEAGRVSDAFFDYFTRAIVGPVGGVKQAAYGVEVELGSVVS